MNEVIRQLHERKSVRVFEDREIDEGLVQEILQAAAAAPTAGNQQLYTIIRVTDPDLRLALSRSCDNQPFIATAKLLLVFCADCLKWHDAYLSAGCEPRDPGVGDLVLAIDDALIAAQNAVVAAHSLGLGSCYIGDVMEQAKTHQELLGLPAHVFPAALLVFGYPTRQQQDRPKPERFDLAHIVHENRYRRMGEAELRQMFASRTSTKGFDEWVRAFCARKYDSDFSREMTRSVRAYLEQYH